MFKDMTKFIKSNFLFCKFVAKLPKYRVPFMNILTLLVFDDIRDALLKHCILSLESFFQIMKEYLYHTKNHCQKS